MRQPPELRSKFSGPFGVICTILGSAFEVALKLYCCSKRFGTGRFFKTQLERSGRPRFFWLGPVLEQTKYFFFGQGDVYLFVLVDKNFFFLPVFLPCKKPRNPPVVLS